MRKNTGRIILPVLIIAAAFLLEIVFAAFPYFTCVMGNDITTDYSTGYPKIIDSDNCQLTLEFNNTPMYGVKFQTETSEEDPFYCDVSIFFKTEGSDDYEFSQTHKFVITSEQKDVVFYEICKDNVSSAVLSFDCEGHTAIVGNFEVNPIFHMSLSLARFAIIAIILELVYICIVQHEKIRTFLTPGKIGVIAVIICLSMSAFMSYCTYDKSEKDFTEYPLNYDVKYYDPYVQQFDAFQKGQLNIDVVPDENFVSLENPYDPDQREGTNYLWDRAFYNGKYYSYFGVAPIVLIYEPWYLITGSLPTGSTVLTIFSLIASIFLPLAVVELSKKFGKNCSPLLTLSLAVGTTFSSMIYLIQRGISQFYYIASAGGIAFTGVFIFLLLKAFNTESKKAKYPLFILAGAAFGIIFHCRINNALIPGLIALVTVITYLVKSIKEKAIPQYILHMICLGTPVLLAVGASFVYNFVRFGSPLEFGTTYQLTVADVSTYAIDFNGIIPSIYHYLLQRFDFLHEFPYVDLLGKRLDKGEICHYVDQGLGAFAFPLNILMLLAPITHLIKKKSHTSDFLLVSTLIGIFGVAFTDYCLGGVIFRYTGDIAVSCGLAASLAIFCLYSGLKKRPARIATGVVSAIFSSASLLTAFIASLSFSGNLMDYPISVYNTISGIFSAL